MIKRYGEPRTEEIVRGWVANQPTLINGDAKILEAIAAGQCDVGRHQHLLPRARPGQGRQPSGAPVLARPGRPRRAREHLRRGRDRPQQAPRRGHQVPRVPLDARGAGGLGRGELRVSGQSPGAPASRCWSSGAPSRWTTSTSPARVSSRPPRRSSPTAPGTASRFSAMTRVSGVAGAIVPGPRRSWPWSAAALVAAAVVSLPILTVLVVARPSRLGGLGASRAHPAAGTAPQHGGPGRRGRPRGPPPRDDARVARRHVRVPGPAAVRVGAGPAARPPGLRHRLRLPGPLRVRGPAPDRPPRLARSRRPPPGPPLGLGGGAHDDARLLPLRVHARARGARRAGAGVPGDRARPRALADGDPVRRHPAPGAPRARRRDGPGLHGGAGGLRHRRDVQLPHADRGDLPRVARDVRSRRGDPARRDPPRAGRRPPGARAPLARARPVHARAAPGAPARAASTRGIRALGATLLCAGTLGLAFGLPVGQLIVWAIEAARAGTACPRRSSTPSPRA